MGQLLHGCARTTAAVRRAIQSSQESLIRLSERYDINPKTVHKWRKRSFVAVMCLLSAMPSKAAGRQIMKGHVPAAVSGLTPLGRLQSSQHLTLAIGLPIRNQAELTTLLRSLYNPATSSQHECTSSSRANACVELTLTGWCLGKKLVSVFASWSSLFS